jgi:hypothetical protein
LFPELAVILNPVGPQGQAVLDPDSCKVRIGHLNHPRQQILARPTQHLHKNVTNFADKRDKGLPLFYRLGLAYMVLTGVNRKKRELFFAGYFGERRVGDLKIQWKTTTSIRF